MNRQTCVAKWPSLRTTWLADARPPPQLPPPLSSRPPPQRSRHRLRLQLYRHRDRQFPPERRRAAHPPPTAAACRGHARDARRGGRRRRRPRRRLRLPRPTDLRYPGLGRRSGPTTEGALIVVFALCVRRRGSAGLVVCRSRWPCTGSEMRRFRWHGWGREAYVRYVQVQRQSWTLQECEDRHTKSHDGTLNGRHGLLLAVEAARSNGHRHRNTIPALRVRPSGRPPRAPPSRPRRLNLRTTSSAAPLQEDASTHRFT